MVKIKKPVESRSNSSVSQRLIPGIGYHSAEWFGFVLVFGRQTVLTASASSKHLDKSAHTPRQTRVPLSMKIDKW